jgi:endoribonuclease Dicer
MRRIDDMLLVIELNATLFDHTIQKDQLHAAVSAPSACTESDYERLELLGDSYLKYLSSIYLFVTSPAQHEGALHSARLRIISNKALFLNAESVGLASYIQARPFVARQWSPPNFTVIPPPPPKSSIVESATTVNEGSPEREACANGSEAQSDEGEEKAHGCMSQGWYLGVNPDLFNLPVITDSVNSSDSVVHEGVVAEKSTLETDGDKGTAPGEAPKPPVERLPSKKSKKDDPNVQWLGEKVISTQYQRVGFVYGLQAIADVVEAIIGAAYVSGGSETALNASKALRIAVPSVDQWSDFARKALAPPPDVTTRLQPGTVEAIEVIMGHTFRRPHILAQALVRQKNSYLRKKEGSAHM